MRNIVAVVFLLLSCVAASAQSNGGPAYNVGGGGSGSIAIGTTTITGGTSPGLLYVTSGNTVGSVLLNGLCGLNAFTAAQCAAFFGYVQPEWYGAVGNGKILFDGTYTATNISSITSQFGTAPTTTSITTLTANDFLVSVFSTDNTVSPAPSPNLRASAYTASHFGILAVDQVIASPSVTTPVAIATPGQSHWIGTSLALAPSSGNSISFVNSTTYQATTASSFTIGIPSGYAAGDYMIACFHWYESSSGVHMNQPGGWSFIIGTLVAPNNYETCYGHNVVASEPTSYTFSSSPSSNNVASGIILDYRGTSGLDGGSQILSSATAAFTSADVGKLICLSGLSTPQTGASPNEACSTITTYNSATQVITGLTAINSGSTATFAMGTSDSTAFSNMLSSSVCTTRGCLVELQPKNYVQSASLSIPPNSAINISGAGPGLPNTENSTLHGGAANANNGTILDWLTQSLSTPAFKLAGPVGTTSTTASTLFENFALLGGVGVGRDGGGGDGLDVINWQSANFNNVYVFNFAGDGIYIDGAAATNYSDYIENILMQSVYVGNNGGPGIQVGSSSDVYNLESVQCAYCIIETNGGPGVLLAGQNIQGFILTGSTVQWNNSSAAAPEVSTTGTVVGGVIEGDYFEVDGIAGSLSSSAFGNTAGMLGIRIGSNYYATPSSYVPLVFSAAGTALPSCSASSAITNNATATVSDATQCVSGATYTSGGSVRCSVTCTGGNWVENFGGSTLTNLANSTIGGGTTFSTSGCAVSATAGGSTNGSYTSGTTGACTVTVTMGGSLTAAHGWSCSVWDTTTTTDTQKQTTFSTTSATFTGTTVSGDVVAFGCNGF